MIAVALVVTALFVQAQKQSGIPASGSPERGKTFFQRDCAICHTGLGVASDKSAANAEGTATMASAQATVLSVFTKFSY